ncbi:hypothetical protein LXL04_018085 [Taraxacum kok-saghyz]
MVDNNMFGMYLKVDLNYNGLFVTNPRSYEGGEHFLFTDMDFVGLDYNGCMTFLERFTGEPFEKLFYCLRNRPLSTGIRFIEDDVDYAHFLDTAYEEPENPISIYLDHSGDGLEDWFESSSEENGSVIQGDKSSRKNTSETPNLGQPGETHPVDDATETPQVCEPTTTPNVTEATQTDNVFEGQFFVDEIVPDDFDVNLNKTVDDPFLSKLCGDELSDEEEDETTPLEQPRFNPDLH